jgi:hypothetical protein
MFGKTLKGFTGAAFLALLALPVVAQQSAESRTGQQQNAKQTISLTPHYLVAFGRPLARTDKYGITKFNYQNGRLFSEIQPNGVVGTYQYDAGKFTGVVYTDGRYIKVETDASGALSGLTTDTGRRVTFSVESKPTRLSAFLIIQKAITALRNPATSNLCRGGDGEEEGDCIVRVSGTHEPEEPDWGDQPYGDWARDAVPYFGEGGGGGGISNPPGETPKECKVKVCVPTNATFRHYCGIATHTPASWMACIDKATEYYTNCVRSCETNDWSWLDWWVFAW